MHMIWDADELGKLQTALKQVLWIGGGTDAGKTTTAKLLGEKYQLPVYHGDLTGAYHWNSINADTQPSMDKWINWGAEQRWVDISVNGLVDITLRIITERLPRLVDDLIQLSQGSKVIVEWYGFFPDMLVPLLTYTNQAIWMFPSPQFKQDSITRRNKTQYHTDTSDPEKAWENHLERDLRMSRLIQKQAIDHQQAILINDRAMSQQRVFSKTEEHFADLLPTS